ncbi:hypothetical protein [Methylobacterium haplocladii]|uniref:Uncharacterized protein n=1 Tax=Methylobacterium haplocladii TaxID=1176176 RepID=A0A512ISF1_9HYPH|nr:hypothetical protein [Methylobacterium haplocladii]GEP00569.1 hypothetical protein MHA02_29560 [Methylobacterium haplocladii]GJD85484.1 hypothetical protein HPGCJGGD_3373 [Methylobacterium haplocladii]GLS57717.1 hypothetical protein GCM10007887_03730 [Methylobacterium haplocladii]
MNPLAAVSLFLVGTIAVGMILIPILDDQYRRAVDAWASARVRAANPVTVESEADRG